MHRDPLTHVDDLFSLDIPVPYKQDLLYQNLLGLLTAKKVGQAMAHVQTEQWNSQDAQVRDILFGGAFPEEGSQPNMFMYTQSHL